MSEQVTERVTLTRLTDDDASVHLDAMLEMNEYDIDDYLYDNHLYLHTNGVFYKKRLHRYNGSDFVQVTKMTPSVVEFVASYYNGGCHIDEIIEGVLNEKY